jgi:transcription factor C subunit 6
MSRQLRARKSRPNYVELATGITAGSASNAERDKSGAVSDAMALDEDSGSDFDPEGTRGTALKDDVTEDEEGADGNIAMDEEDDELETEKPAKKQRVSVDKPATSISAPRKRKPKASVFASGMLASSSSRPSLAGSSSRRINNGLATPSLHHRHRAVPLFHRPGAVERLTAKPSLFEEPKTALTNGFTHSVKITDRVSRAWGYNIGEGPLWELVEDRAWYKECENDLSWEKQRRPKVYQDLKQDIRASVISLK